MRRSEYEQRAEKYFIQDIAAALLPGSRLFNIIENLDSWHPVSADQQDFLRKKGLSALAEYAKSLSLFMKKANEERVQRCQTNHALSQENEKKLEEEVLGDRMKLEQAAAEAKRQQDETEGKRQQKEKIDRVVLVNAKKRETETQEDRIKNKYGISASILKNNFPELYQNEVYGNFSKNKALPIGNILTCQDLSVKAEFPAMIYAVSESKAHDELIEKYNVSKWLKSIYFNKLIDILQHLDSGCRLSEVEFAWLKTTVSKYESDPIEELYHKNEAVFYAEEFKKKKDCWLAVNASSHYRKCHESNTADALLRTIDFGLLKDSKLKSALCTTHGGVKRDLRYWREALSLGEQAHQLTPKDFRPCTLLGAVNMEIGNYDLGRSWYDKAIERGYSEQAMDDELRSIFMRAEKSRQDEMREYLLKLDPVRYSWAKKKISKNSAAAVLSPSIEALLKLAIADLIKRKDKKPRTAKALRSTIHARCGKNLPESEIDKVWDALIRRGHIKINDEQVSYSLPASGA